MTPKQQLITRLARWTAIVLAAALLVSGLAALKEYGDRRAWYERRDQRRAKLFEDSRTYLNELAQRVTSAPVDPTLVSEIESDYFAEYENGPMSVWAMATDGSFLFGVPRETFSRMNAIYDREITPRLEEGVFFDRQSFFLGHLDDAGETLLLLDASEEDTDLWERLNVHLDQSEGSFVLSAPLENSDGGALGSIYLNRSASVRQYYRHDDRVQTIATGAAVLAMLAFVFLWLLLPTWVYVDARERRVARGALFAFLTALSSLVGLVVYLIARPENAGSVVCPGCEREIDGGAYCPHCGHDLSATLCQTCRYPLQPDWAFCPSCRTEIRAGRAPAGLSVPGAESPDPETA